MSRTHWIIDNLARLAQATLHSLLIPGRDQVDALGKSQEECLLVVVDPNALIDLAVSIANDKLDVPDIAVALRLAVERA